MTENTIAFNGLAGAYAELACKTVYPEMNALPCPSFAKAFDAVHEGRAKFAMIPIENSSAGRVADVHRLIPKSNLFIIGEHFQPINHCLVTNKNTEAEDIRIIYSHPQALLQCAENIAAMEDVETMTTADTATAAQLVSKKRGTVAAVAAEYAAEIYDLQIVKRNFQDRADNVTRFLILSREHLIPAPTEATITSVLFRLKSVPAALHQALGGFADAGINLTRIESYMVGNKFQTAQFYIDAECHPENAATQQALSKLTEFSEEIRILGTYAKNPFRNT
ncbi:MAG: prephenate dehydratase domain-containing protein [Alphaproteobacteria bacterium]